MMHILVPVDFSPTSLNALQYATRLFGGADLEITVLHTYDVSSSAFRMKSMDRIMEADAQGEMNTLLKQMRTENPNLTYTDQIIKGSAVQTITRMGNTGKFDCIVMGTKGASGLQEVFLGSVAGGVIAKTQAPVLVVPDHCEDKPLQKIVFAISGKPFSDPKVITPLRQLAEAHGAKIDILHVAEKEKADLEDVVGGIQGLHPSITYAFGVGNINKRLSQYVEEEEADMLCLVRGKRDFFNRIFGESVTLKQTFSSTVPLLILHD